MQGRRVRSQIVMMMVVMMSAQIVSVSSVVVQVSQWTCSSTAGHQSSDCRGDTHCSCHGIVNGGMVIVQVVVLVVGVRVATAAVIRISTSRLSLAAHQVLQTETRCVGHRVHDGR